MERIGHLRGRFLALLVGKYNYTAGNAISRGEKQIALTKMLFPSGTRHRVFGKANRRPEIGNAHRKRQLQLRKRIPTFCSNHVESEHHSERIRRQSDYEMNDLFQNVFISIPAGR
jgi:hypothetical protein